MNYRLKKPIDSEMLSIPLSLLDRLAEIGEDELKFILAAYAFESEGKDGEDMFDYIGEKCALSREQCGEAAAFWRGAGFLQTGKKAGVSRSAPEKKRVLFDPEKKPSYSSQDIADAAKDTIFRDLLEYAQNRLGKTFNTSELATLYSFLDYLKMPAGVVMLVIEHCAAKGKGSLRYVEKMLISLADAGVDTYPKAEAYLQDCRKKQAFEARVRDLLGLGSRGFTSKEKSAVNTWQNEFNTPFELITLAYEKTINAIKQPSIPYMHTILEGWFREGITSTEQLENKTAAFSQTDSERSYDPVAFFEAAVRRGERKGV